MTSGDRVDAPHGTSGNIDGAIVREWRGRVPNALADAYVDLMRSRAIPDYRSTPGNLAALCLTRAGEKVTEVTMLTIWSDRASIAAFAGDDISIAKYYDFDRDFLMELDDSTIRHHEVRDGRFS